MYVTLILCTALKTSQQWKVSSLNFSSAGEGLFMASKAKNAPEAHFPGNDFRQIGLSKCLILIILLCLQRSLEFPRCIAHIVHTFIHFLDQIRPQLAYFLKLQYLILVIFSFQFNFQLQVVRSAASAACKESCVRQPGTSGFCSWARESCS